MGQWHDVIFTCNIKLLVKVGTNCSALIIRSTIINQTILFNTVKKPRIIKYLIMTPTQIGGMREQPTTLPFNGSTYRE